MSKIYKINYLINNEIKNIYVFKGNFVLEQTDRGPTINGKHIFTEMEWTNISENNITLTYIDRYIHQEDEISTTTLDGTLSSSATTVTVASTTGFDSTGTIFIENEQITYTGTTSTTFTGATRGANSTTAASHSDSTQVAQFDKGGIPTHVVRTLDNNFLLYPFPNKTYSLKYDFFTFASDLSSDSDTPTIPDRFSPVITDGATAFVYQYRGETQQYQINFERFEQGIKNMQSLLVNKYEYVRSTMLSTPSIASSYFTMDTAR